MLAFLLGLTGCQSGPAKPGPGSDSATAPDLDADLSLLTPTEEDIIRAFRLELEEDWLEAAIIYNKLSQSSVQP